MARTHISSEPLLALRSALSSYVLYAELDGSAFQVGLCCAIRPVMALLSFYWASNLSSDGKKIKSNLIGAWVFARVPFVFLPFVSNGWYIIFSEAIFYLFSRGSIPAMVEIMHVNMKANQRNRSMALSFGLQFFESIILGLLFTALLANNWSNWKWLYCVTALIGLSSAFFQNQIPLLERQVVGKLKKMSLKQRIIQPWLDSLALLKNRPDFARFQLGFMIGGFALMLMSPAIIIYSVDILGLSSANMSLARNVLIGIGVVVSVAIWNRALTVLAPAYLLSIVVGLFGFFAFLLLVSQYTNHFFYIAFFVYGIAQAGSHLLWHLSGSMFAKDEPSSKFTVVNILLVGLRGLVAPGLGSLLCVLVGPVNVLILGTVILIIGTWKLLKRCCEATPIKT